MGFDAGRVLGGARQLARSVAELADGPVRAVGRRQVLDHAHDDTDAAVRRRTLVVVAHPGDETLGCGATIARKRAAGTDVVVVMVCDGRHGGGGSAIGSASSGPHVRLPSELAVIRANRTREAVALVGLAPDDLHLLGFEETTLERCLDALADVVAEHLVAVAPEELLLPGEDDEDPDRRLVHAAVLRAVAVTGWDGLLGASPISAWAGGPRRGRSGPGGGWPRHGAARAVQTDGFADLKRRALEIHRSTLTLPGGETDGTTFPAGWVEPFLGPAELFFAVPELAVRAAGAGRDGAPPAFLARTDDRSDHRPPPPVWAVTPEVAITAESAASLRPGGPPDGEASDRWDTLSGPDVPLLALPFVDRFLDARGGGWLEGTLSTSGVVRRIADPEAVLSSGNGRLGVGPVQHPGWGRTGVAYGPFRRRDGHALVVRVVLGAQPAPTGGRARSRVDRVEQRLRRRPRTDPHRGGTVAVGLFAEPWAPLGCPTAEDLPTGRGRAPRGNVVVVPHVAAGPQAVGMTVGDRVLPLPGAVLGPGTARTVGTAGTAAADAAPDTWIVALRPSGAVYYAGDACTVRPVAADGWADDAMVFPAVWSNGATGEVRGVAFGPLDGDDAAGVLVVDDFAVPGSLDDRPAGPARAHVGIAPRWRITAGSGRVARVGSRVGRPPGRSDRADHGQHGGAVVAGEAGVEVLTDAGAPAGLVHLAVETAPVFTDRGWCGLRFRSMADGRGWRVVVDADRAAVEFDDGDGWSVVAADRTRLTSANRHHLQVVDDGERFGVVVDGQLLFGRWLTDGRFAEASHVGFVSGDGSRTAIRRFEAIARSLPTPRVTETC